MPGLIRIVLAVILLLVIGSVLLLTLVDLQPPTQPVEKIIPNDRFNR